MTDLIIVKTDNRKNYTGTFPGVGKVTIDENGEFASDPDSFNELKECFPEFYDKAIGKPKQPTNDLIEKEKKKEELQDLSDELDEDEKEELRLAQDKLNKQNEDQAELIESIKAKNYKEIEELCKEFPGTEWRSKNKEERVQYLITKLTT